MCINLVTHFYKIDCFVFVFVWFNTNVDMLLLQRRFEKSNQGTFIRRCLKFDSFYDYKSDRLTYINNGHIFMNFVVDIALKLDN
jgi:hypothetical protein